jgi:hypothetical protein
MLRAHMPDKFRTPGARPSLNISGPRQEALQAMVQQPTDAPNGAMTDSSNAP